MAPSSSNCDNVRFIPASSMMRIVVALADEGPRPKQRERASDARDIPWLLVLSVGVCPSPHLLPFLLTKQQKNINNDKKITVLIDAT
jgi:hypothetical protein